MSDNLFQSIQLKSDLIKKQEQLQDDKEFFQNELTARNVAFENLQHRFEEKKGELEQLQEKFTKDFEIIANKILDEKSTKFTLQNKENLDALLKPLQEKIKRAVILPEAYHSDHCPILVELTDL